MPCDFRLDHPRRSNSGCLFPEENAVEFGGKMWCRFHLPIRRNDEYSPKADWSGSEIDAFREAIFAYIDEARSQGRVADLSGAVLPWDLSFERYARMANSLPEILFIGTHFGGNARFTKAIFGGRAWFDQAVFDGGAWFNEAMFDGDASFDGARFIHAAMFDRANFSKQASFDHADFNGIASFMKAVFGTAHFGGASFRGDAWFDEADFRAQARFERTTFLEEARFPKARFGREASFCKGTFRVDACFSGATFVADVWFTGTAFGRNAAFSMARFDGGAFFNGTGGAAPEGSTFDLSDFSDTKFGGLAQFKNKRFLNTTNFSGALFERAPEFHGSTLHHDTQFPKKANFRDRGGADAARAYRTLKYAMASVHARSEEAKFFALEQRGLRRDKDTPVSTKLFSRLYWRTSDYGESIFLPLIWIMAILVLFLCIYATYIPPQPDPLFGFVIPPIYDEQVLHFAFRQVFQPFDALRARPSAPPGTLPAVLQNPPLWLAVLAALHSVATLSFLALFLLALRRRFKLD